MKNILLKGFFALGGHIFSKILSRKHPRILMYHRFGAKSTFNRLGADVFESQIKILKRFNVISLNTLCSALSNKEPIAPNSVVITIDDGYEDFYLYACPILKKYNIPATVYVVTDFVDNKIWLWPDIIAFIFARTSYSAYTITLNGNVKHYKLTTDHEQLKAWSDIADHCLTLKNKDKGEFIRNLGADLKVSIPSVPTSDYKPLSWKQIKEMQRYGIGIGSHTCTHPRLVMTDTDELSYEITHSKKRIEEVIDKEVESFCYPHGARIDFNDEVKKMVKEAGYKNATVAFCDTKTSDMFELRRYSIGRNMLQFKENIYGIKFLSNKIKRL